PLAERVEAHDYSATPRRRRGLYAIGRRNRHRRPRRASGGEQQQAEPAADHRQGGQDFSRSISGSGISAGPPPVESPLGDSPFAASACTDAIVPMAGFGLNPPTSCSTWKSGGSDVSASPMNEPTLDL